MTAILLRSGNFRNQLLCLRLVVLAEIGNTLFNTYFWLITKVTASGVDFEPMGSRELPATHLVIGGLLAFYMENFINFFRRQGQPARQFVGDIVAVTGGIPAAPMIRLVISEMGLGVTIGNKVCFAGNRAASSKMFGCQDMGFSSVIYIHSVYEVYRHRQTLDGQLRLLQPGEVPDDYRQAPDQVRSGGLRLPVQPNWL